MNKLVELWSHKQSYWLDFIRRNMLKNGELKKMVAQDGLRGMTSNPTIFEKAIGAGDDYDQQLKALALKGLSPNAIFEEIAITDVRDAADILKPVFKSSKGTDGFVSLEVSPDLANNTEGTTAQAIHYWKKVKRPNLMIKIPGTQACIKSIEDSLASGVNINITLLFSVENYKQVLEAYLKALERRVKKGQPIKNLSSVASFFVSRVDVIVDKELDRLIAENGSLAGAAKNLLHKAAIANAKVAYAHYEQVMASPRWAKLKAKGAQPQRLLWASTGGKDKRLPDVLYIDELIGPDTVNTMPPATAEAFKDHGNVQEKIREGLDQARRDLAALSSVNIDFEKYMQKLQDDGVNLFIGSFDSLMRVVGAKAEVLTGRLAREATFNVGTYQGDVNKALERIDAENWTKRIWEKDAALWKSDDAHKKIISNSLGWLTVPDVVRRNLKLVNDIAADVKKAGFTHALLLGMGGSSLCPEVLRLSFGKKAGYPDLAILDSTEPASVADRAKRSKPEKTLYIVASKSGSTTEPNAFLAYFYDLVKKKKGAKAGENFIAITDPGTQMEKIAREKNFRHIVLNPSDIGGRYSALSFFGMLPAAIMGIDVSKLVDSGAGMAAACSPTLRASANPGAHLGAVMGSLAVAGRNKVTFFLSKDIASFATWVEQLIAESTGKEGKGILPVESEPLGSPAEYGMDRVFVSISTKSDTATEKKLVALKKAGHPVISIRIKDAYSIPAEFFRWEFATAVAGGLMGIDPFDQPNVQESKDLTKQFLEQFKSQGKLSSDQPTLQEQGVSAFAFNGGRQAGSLEELIHNLLGDVRAGDYVALLAYLERNPKHEQALQQIRDAIHKSKKVATTVGFGPRFLHSTGQLHKGGDNSGVFLQITADDKKDLPIPGEPYTYSVLKEAQALGDLSALTNKHRRAVRIHLHDADKGLALLRNIVKKATKN